LLFFLSKKHAIKQSQNTLTNKTAINLSEQLEQNKVSHLRIPYLASQCLHLSIAQRSIAEHNKKEFRERISSKQERTKNPLLVINQKVTAATGLPEESNITAVHTLVSQ